MTASREESLAVLNWLLDAGADEAMGASPVDRFTQRNADAPRTSPLPAGEGRAPLAQIKPANLAPLTTDGFGSAQAIAARCGTLAELKAALESFEGSHLKKLATNTVFADGTSDSRIMFIGEAPGQDEDRAGLPFVGRAGKL